VMAKIHVGWCCLLTWFSFTFPFLSVILWFFLLNVCYFVFSLQLFSMFSHCLLLVASQYHGWVFLLLLDLQLKCSSQVSGCIDLYLLSAADEIRRELWHTNCYQHNDGPWTSERLSLFFILVYVSSV
jgi:hypothetical protein